MNKLSNFQIDKIMDNFLKENLGKVELTENQLYETKEIFNNLMLDEANKNKTLKDQESLITDIMVGFSFGETKERLVRAHSSNKHMNFFDTVMEEGQSDKVQEALFRNGISTDVLRGIKAGKEINISVDTEKGKVEIKGQIHPSPDGENDENDFFEIWLNGNVIYSWDRYAFDDIDFGYTDFEEVEYEPEPPKEQPKTKSGKPRKGIYLATIINSNGEEATMERTSRGQIIYRAKNGRFTKK